MQYTQAQRDQMFFQEESSPNFPQLGALNFDRIPDGEIVSNEDYIRIGDSPFSIPPTAIGVSEVSNNHAEPIPRSRGGLVQNLGQVEKMITITLAFTSAYEIFGLPEMYDDYLDPENRRLPSGYLASPPVSEKSLAALIAQFKRTPIVPVVNDFLNNLHDISAMTLETISVKPMRDESGTAVPNCMEVTLAGRAFDIAAICPGIINFSAALNYPMIRWHWRQEFAEFLPGQWAIQVNGGNVPSQPTLLPGELSVVSNDTTGQRFIFRRSGIAGCTGEYQFTAVDPEWLKEIADRRDEFNHIQAFGLSDAFKNLAKEDRENFYSSLANYLNEITLLADDANARLIPVDLNKDMELLDVSCSMNNDFASMTTPSTDTPFYQHMAQGNVRITATFWAFNEDAITSIRYMIERSRQAVRDSRFEMVAGFLGFENEITSLFGVHSVVITNIAAQNVEGVPGNYIITLEMISFERHQRQIETIKSASRLPQYYLDQGSATLRNMPEDLTLATDPRYVFWSRYLAAYSPDKDPHQASGSNQQQGPGFTDAGAPVNAWFNGAYIQEAKELMSFLELYPDLKLPTYNRLVSALSNNEIFNANYQDYADLALAYQKMRYTYWSKGGRYIDPDFYVDYPNFTLASKLNVTSGTDPTRDPSAYLKALTAEVSNNEGLNPQLILNRDCSISDAINCTLLDHYSETATLMGPDPKQTGYEPTGDPSVQVRSEAGETGTPRGTNVCHATVTMPMGIGIAGKETITTNHILPTWMPPEMEIDFPNIEGTTRKVRVPDQGVAAQTAANNKMSGFAGMQGAHEGIQDAANTVLGLNNDGKDKTAFLNQAIMAHHPIDIGSQITDEHGRIVAATVEMQEYDYTARFVQAFPSYVFQLLDEGPKLGWVNLFPNFSSLQAITSIDVINDRRVPDHTAMVEIMNTYGNLSSYTQSQLNMNAINAFTNYSGNNERILGNLQAGASNLFSGIVNNNQGTDDAKVTAGVTLINDSIGSFVDGLLNPVRVLLPGVGNDIVSNAAEIRRKQQTAVMLAPGVRIHIRMGYGANGAALPVIFNGRITDVSVGERVRLVAMGDGVELAKQIPSSESNTNSINGPQGSFLTAGIANGAFLDQTYEPRDLICRILGSHDQSLFDYSLGGQFWNGMKDLIFAGSGGGAYNENPIGICHFGNPYLWRLWDTLGADNNIQTEDGATAASPAGSIVSGPLKISAYNKVVTEILNSPNPQNLSPSQRLLNAGLDPQVTQNPYSVASGVDTAAYSVAGGIIGGAVTSIASLNGVPISQAQRLGQFASSMVGAEATFLQQAALVGYGETGENVYAIYTPALKFFRQFGSYSSAIGINGIVEATAAAATPGTAPVNLTGSQASIDAAANTDFDTPELPDALGTPYLGPHLPGVSFNMYTKNKTVWDVFTTMAQYFPPYIAAVVPFEYRSTFFFGAPYFQFRYDYDRVTAADLGKDTTTDLDRFYGYPYGYKTKVFSQFHYYDSKLNLIGNNVRATEEQTYTDVIALWYKGQGVSSNRQEPYSVHQTVDKQVGDAFRKTAIVNTDVMGFDTAPSASSIIGSAGVSYGIYVIENFGWGSTTAAGAIDHWITEPNMKNMTRAILRDYQKLMYQGEILVVGDPTVKPHDIIGINDEYTDMQGVAGVRRVIHHFGYDTGFVTSIEPDLLCEVKGQNLSLTFLTWLTTYVFGNIGVRLGGKYALALAEKTLVKSFGKLLSRIFNIAGPVAKLGGKVLGGYGKGSAYFAMRRFFLGRTSKLLFGGKGIVAKSIGGDLGATRTLVQNVAKEISQANLFGDVTKEQAAVDSYQAKIYNAIAESIGQNSNKFTADVINEALAKNLGTVTAGNIEDGIGATIVDLLGKEAILKLLADPKRASVFAKLSLFGAKTGPALAAAIAKIAASSEAEIAAADATIGEFTGAFVDLFEALTTINLATTAELGPYGIIKFIVVQLMIGLVASAISNWFDDDTSLVCFFLKYRGAEYQAGLNGHSQNITVGVQGDGTQNLTLTDDEWKDLVTSGFVRLNEVQAHLAALSGQTASTSPTGKPPSVDPGPAQSVPQIGPDPTFLNPGPVKNKYSQADRIRIAAYHNYDYGVPGLVYNTIIAPYTGVRGTPGVSDRVIQFMEAAYNNGITMTISAACGASHTSNWTTSDHPNGWCLDVDYVNGNDVDGTKPFNVASFQLLSLAVSFNPHQIGAAAYQNPSAGPYSSAAVAAQFNSIVPNAIQIPLSYGDGATHIHLDFGQ